MMIRLVFHGRTEGERGFTLVETMVAILLSAIVVVSAMQAFLYQRRALHANELESEMRHNVRTCLDMLARDLRLAGYGLDMEPSELPSWVDWVHDVAGNPVTFDANPKIVDGAGGAPDAIWIGAAFDEPAAYLASTAMAGATMLQLGSGEGAAFNDSDRKLLFLGKLETARVVSVSGDTLTISTHPSQAIGLDRKYPAGTRVELISVRSYELNSQTASYPYTPHVTRDNNQSNVYTYAWERLIASHIEDLQLVQTNNQVSIEITGRASVKDFTYEGRGEGDLYRRLTVSSSAFGSNLP